MAVELWKGMSSMVPLRPDQFNGNMSLIEKAVNTLFTQLATGEFVIAEGSVTNAMIDRLTAKKLVVESADIADASITNLKIDRATANRLVVLSADIAEAQINNAHIDRATVNKLQVLNSDIVDLAANKITSGELSTERLIIRSAADPTKSLIYEINNITGALQAVQGDTLNGEVVTPRSITTDRLVADCVTANEILAGAITVEKLSILAKNYVNNHAVTGNLTGWTHYGSIITSGIKGDSYVHEVITTGSQQIFSDYFEIDPKKTYKVTLSVFCDSTDGARYFGLNCINKLGTELAVTPFYVNGKYFETAKTNPYFWSRVGNTGGYIDIEAYIVGCDVQAHEIPLGRNTTYSFKMPPSAHRVRLRYLNYGTAGVSRRALFWGPSVTEVDAGALRADSVITGRVKSANGLSYFDLDTGHLEAVDANLTGYVNATSGKIGNMIISSDALTLTVPKVFGPYTQTDITRVQGIVDGSITPTATDYDKYDFYGYGKLSVLHLTVMSRMIAGTYGWTNPVTVNYEMKISMTGTNKLLTLKSDKLADTTIISPGSMSGGRGNFSNLDVSATLTAGSLDVEWSGTFGNQLNVGGEASITGSLKAYGGVAVRSGLDLVFYAASGDDTGDIVFKNTSDIEVGRLWRDAANPAVKALRARGGPSGGGYIYTDENLVFDMGNATITDAAGGTDVNFNFTFPGTPRVWLIAQTTTSGVLSPKVRSKTTTGFNAAMGGSTGSINCDWIAVYKA